MGHIRDDVVDSDKSASFNVGLTIYSDGGGEKGSVAASACIVAGGGLASPLKVVLFLGPATNNEAEITGGLAGYSLIHALGMVEPGATSLTWVCDSEYVLKSATAYILQWQKNGWKTASKQPVKNQGLWRTYLTLSRGIRVHPQHVRGHSGHPENEACDAASTWAQSYGEEELAGWAPDRPLVVNVSARDYGEGWFVFDGRDYLNALRTDYPAEEGPWGLVERFSATEIKKALK